MTFAAFSLPFLFVLSAFFSGSETVLFSLTGAQRARIKARNARADARIGRCLADQAVFFSTLLVGNTLVNFLISTIGYCLFANWLPGGGWLAVPAMTVALLVFGEITPKRLALKYAEEVAPTCARLLLFWRILLSPFNHVLRFMSRAFAPALARERRALSDDELVSVMESAAEHGDVSSADAEMVERVLRLSELCANDEMTPRVDIDGYDIDRDEAFRAAARAIAARGGVAPVIWPALVAHVSAAGNKVACAAALVLRGVRANATGQVVDDVAALVHRLAVNQQARALPLAANAHKVVAVRALGHVQVLDLDVVLAQKRVHLRAEGASRQDVELQVVKAGHGGLPSFVPPTLRAGGVPFPAERLPRTPRGQTWPNGVCQK